MAQLGCFNACAAVTLRSCSFENVRNGPPEAVSRILRMGLASPTIHCRMAECSLSTGRMATWLSKARRLMIAPATTSVSLLARAMVLPALMASTVGRKPEKPTMAVSTTSMSPEVTTWLMASAPAYTLIGKSERASCTILYCVSSAITTVSGLKARACLMSSSALRPAVSVCASKRSGWRLITSSVCVPIEPVEPKTAIFFLDIYIMYIVLRPPLFVQFHKPVGQVQGERAFLQIEIY